MAKDSDPRGAGVRDDLRRELRASRERLRGTARRAACPRAYSGHNALWRFGRPPDGAAVIVLGFRERGWLEGLFVGCREAARVDNGLEVENEEQGGPIWVCRAPSRPWSALWPELRHLDDLAVVPSSVVPSGSPWRLGVSKPPSPRRTRMKLHGNARTCLHAAG